MSNCIERKTPESVQHNSGCISSAPAARVQLVIGKSGCVLYCLWWCSCEHEYSIWVYVKYTIIFFAYPHYTVLMFMMALQSMPGHRKYTKKYAKRAQPGRVQVPYMTYMCSRKICFAFLYNIILAY